MSRLDQLADLQAIDIRIDEQARARREAEALLANNSALVSFHQTLAETTAHAKEIRARLTSLELEANGIEEHIKTVESRLYDGRTSNPKELSGLEQDSVMLKRRKSEVEDRMLEAMAELETVEMAERSGRQALEQAAGARSGAVTRATVAIESIDATTAKLRDSRQHISTLLVPADLAIYENLRTEKKGRAVAHIKGSSCEMCGFSIPSGVASRARVSQELEFCSNCGRILIP